VSLSDDGFIRWYLHSRTVAYVGPSRGYSYVSVFDSLLTLFPINGIPVTLVDGVKGQIRLPTLEDNSKSWQSGAVFEVHRYITYEVEYIQDVKVPVT
jgi:hypothetical protein